MADILQITEDIPVDDSIYEYEYKEYNPIAGTIAELNRGSIVIVIEAQDIFTHPAESFLLIEGELIKSEGGGRYANGDNITLINNGLMYLFSDVRYHLASHEIEVLQNLGHATTMLGLLKYPDDFTKSFGINQLWYKDTNTTANIGNNHGFSVRQNFIVATPVKKGSFEFKIPLKHFLGFCEDYKKVLYGMQQKLTLTRTSDDNAIFKGQNAAGNAAAANGKINLKRIRWFMPHVIPSDAYRLQLNKIIEKKEKIPVGHRMLQCDSIQVPTNQKTFTWRLGVKSSPDIPRFIIVGFQSDKNNNQEANPAIFDSLYVRNIYVTLNAKRYPDTDYDCDFANNNFSRIYGDTALFRKKFFNMDEFVSNFGINPPEFKTLFPLYLFDVSKQSEKLKTSVSDIHIKAFFNDDPNIANANPAPDNPPANTMAYAVIISDRLFHFVSDGSKITNIV